MTLPETSGMTYRRALVLKGTLFELGRVALAKLGHDPYGMLYRHRPWREAIVGTYRAHRDWVMAPEWPQIYARRKAERARVPWANRP